MDSDDHQLNYYVKLVRIPYIGLEVNWDDLVYIFCLFASIPIGLIFKSMQLKPQVKSIISSLIGICMAIAICQKDIYHSIIVTLVNAFFLTVLSPKYVHYFSFVWCFGYLLYFRSIKYFGFTQPVQFANAVQLILTLKAVGLAFEIHDTYMRKKNLAKLTDQLKDKTGEDLDKDTVKIEKLKLEIEFQSLEPRPSFLGMCLYCFCYIGLLTGPYFKYRTYHDWLHINYTSEIKLSSFILSRGKTLPIIMLLYFSVSKIASFKDVQTDEFYENSTFWYRILYMVFMFTLFKLRFYFAWIIAEFSCMTACFGAYPVCSKPQPGAGPTDLVELKKFKLGEVSNRSIDFNTVYNIDEYGVEMKPTVKTVLHTWNKSVQYWMAAYVYKRVFFRPIGQGWTMFVSAYWHGLHPGYYMSMLTCTPAIWAETLMDKGLKKRFISPEYFYIYDFCTWFLRCRLFDYMCMGFILLDFDSTIRFWSSVYYIGHVYCVFFIVLGYVLIKLFPVVKKTE